MINKSLILLDLGQWPWFVPFPQYNVTGKFTHLNKIEVILFACYFRAFYPLPTGSYVFGQGCGQPTDVLRIPARHNRSVYR